MRRGERGSTSIEMVFVMPLLILIVWIGLGAAMFYYGRSAAIAAAQSGATAGAAEHGTEADCQAAAADLISRVGDALQQVTVACTRTGTNVTATISGATLSLVPGWSPILSQSASVPVERLTR